MPLSVLFLLSAIFVLLAISGGMWLCRSTKFGGEAGESIGSVVGATLGLVAFLLAFTFNMAASRFDERKGLFLDDLNAIGTSYLRAGLLSEPYATDARNLIRAYVDLRVEAAREPARLLAAISESEGIQDELWSNVERMLANRQLTLAESLFIQSLNDVIDFHQKRVTVGLQFRVPTTIWLGLYAVTGLAMVVVGFQLGQSRKRLILVILVLALAFSSVITLIADLDRASEGTVRIDQQPLFDLQARLASPP